MARNFQYRRNNEALNFVKHQTSDVQSLRTRQVYKNCSFFLFGLFRPHVGPTSKLYRVHGRFKPKIILLKHPIMEDYKLKRKHFNFFFCKSSLFFVFCFVSYKTVYLIFAAVVNFITIEIHNIFPP